MPHDYPVVDLNKGDGPDITELAEEVHRTRQLRVIHRVDEELVVIAPVRNKTLTLTVGNCIVALEALLDTGFDGD